MKLLSILFAFMLLLLPSVHADLITLRNGDRVTGSIVKKAGGNLTVASVYFGTITMPWDEVESIIANQPLYAELATGETVQGTLTLSGNSLEVEGQAEVQPLERGALVALRNAAEESVRARLLAPRLYDLWAGTASLGWAGAAGNAQTLSFTTGVNAARVTITDKASIYFNAIRASAVADGERSTTAQAVRGGWAYDRNVSSRLFVSVFNDYEYDRFQSLDLRFGVGSGLGYKVLRTEWAGFDLVGGAAYSREKFSTPLIRNSAEAYWGNDYSLRLNSATTLRQSFRMFNNLSEPGEYRMNGDIGLSTKLSTWLSWTLSFSDRYLNNPAPNRRTNDLLYSTGLGFTFAR
jgi:putative salt-induced outer membrane protein YdiY